MPCLMCGAMSIMPPSSAPPHQSVTLVSEMGPPPWLPQDLDITFFVPCYNEEPNVAGALGKLHAVCGQLGLSYEVLVFDDGSRDRTVEVVKDFQQAHPDHPVHLYINQRNRGVARNFFEGAFRARGRYYRLVCGDDVEPVESHRKLLAEMGMADIVIPYFTEIGGRPAHRHAISWTYTRLVNLITGYRLRYYNGCPIYRRYDVMRFAVGATGFGYQAEFLTRLLHEGRSYVEIPLVSIDREGSGSLNWRNFLSVANSLFSMLLLRMQVSLFK